MSKEYPYVPRRVLEVLKAATKNGQNDGRGRVQNREKAKSDSRITPARAKPQHLESVEQRLFVQRFRLDPRTRDLPACAIPNGGRRGPREGAILKAEGVSAGAPDWVLFVPRMPWNGLAIEFKSPTGAGRLTPAQAEWHDRLRAQGYAVHLVKSAQQAWDVLTDYLEYA